MAEPDTTRTFQVGDIDYPHRIGDPSCDAGWCGAHGYPRRCERTLGCRGLVHADFGDESWDGYQVATKCDVCGESAA